MDSDDYVEPIYLESLYKIPDKADVTFFPIKKISEHGDIELQIPKVCKVFGRANVEQQLAHLKYSMPVDIFGWSANKLFRASIIKKNDIRFPEDVVFREDEIFMITYARFINSLEIIDIPLYNYRVLRGGLTSNGMTDSDYKALSKHLLANLRYFQNEIILSGDKRRIIDYRLMHFFKDLSIKKCIKSFSPLYVFMHSNKEFWEFSKNPALVRLFTYPYWLSFFLLLIFLIKTNIHHNISR